MYKDSIQNEKQLAGLQFFQAMVTVGQDRTVIPSRTPSLLDLPLENQQLNMRMNSNLFRISRLTCSAANEKYCT